MVDSTENLFASKKKNRYLSYHPIFLFRLSYPSVIYTEVTYVSFFCGIKIMLYVMSCILLLPERSLDAGRVKYV